MLSPASAKDQNDPAALSAESERGAAFWLASVAAGAAES